MSIYTNQEKEFIFRTKKIIDQYSNIPESNKKYEATLLINCFLGLLIIPQQHIFKKLPQEEISEDKRGISPDKISLSIKNINEGHEKGVNTMLRHIKNSISHYRFTVKGVDSISSIYFEDYSDSTKTHKTFDAEFSLDEITKFIGKFYEFCDKEMDFKDL